MTGVITESRTRRKIYHQLPAQFAAGVKNIEGVRYNEETRQVSFDARIHDDHSANLLMAHASHGEIRLETRTDLNPVELNASTLKAINERSKLKLGADDVVAFDVLAINNHRLRSRLIIPTDSALKKFASDFAIGKSALMDHDKKRAFGKTYSGEVVSDEVEGVAGNWVNVGIYVPTINATPQRLQDLTDALTGVKSFVSVTFFGGDWEYMEAGEGPDGDKRWVYMVKDNPTGEFRLEAWEVSMVYIGDSRGASVKMTATSDMVSIKDNLINGPETEPGIQTKKRLWIQ